MNTLKVVTEDVCQPFSYEPSKLETKTPPPPPITPIAARPAPIIFAASVSIFLCPFMNRELGLKNMKNRVVP